VLVVANTVDRARAVHALLEQHLAKEQQLPGRSAEVSLLIGRSRPMDREGLAERVRDRFGVGRGPAARPVILVATQTVEVGVNLDVDGLVTESASWDALVQRLGRLNRLGRHQDRFPGAAAAEAVAVHDGQADGPVYGQARDVTWAYLSRVAAAAAPGQGIRVSPLQCRDLAAAVPAGAAAAGREVPVLQLPTLDAWSCTGPVPQGDPPVDVFLHGFGTGPAAVAVAWRDGLDDPDRPWRELDADAAGALLQAVPVRAGEQVEVPLTAVRRWMEGLAAAVVSDLETATEVPESGAGRARARRGREPFRALVWRAGDDSGPGAAGRWVWTPAGGIRPGDQLVAPAHRGGLDRYGWAPASVEPVVDVSEPASFAGRRPRPVLRLDPGLGHRLGLGQDDARAVAGAVRRLPAVDQLDQELEDDAVGELSRQLLDVLSAGLGRDPTPAEDGLPVPSQGLPRAEVLRWLAARPRVVAVLDPAAAAPTGGQGGDGEAPRVLQYLLIGGRGVEVEHDDETPASSSAGLAPVGLGRHLGAVRERAGQIAAALGLPEEIVAVVEDAAGWHDAGKVEDRFQVMLHGGDELLAVLAEEPLAKSGLAPGDRSAWRAARARSGLPAGARHEAWSAALVEAYLAQPGTDYPGDRELLVHLVASHHGHARPWLPLVVDDAARPVEYVFGDVKVSVSSAATVSLEHPARFARLNARYGRWGLAHLEAVVRCADMTVSAEGS
jgi:CRISPR-associated endonuclease/helicase Cas3